MRARSLLLCALLAASCQSTVPSEALFGPRAVVTFAGNTTYDDEQLLRATSAELGQLHGRPSKARVDDAAYSIELFYRQKGFPFTVVQYDFEETPDGPMIAFGVEEGPRAELTKIELLGELHYDEEKLIPFFEPRTGFLSRTGYYVASDVAAAEKELENYYYKRGYLRAEAGPQSVVFSHDGARAKISVPVQPGVRFQVRAIDLDGELLLDPKPLERLGAGSIDRPYTPHAAYRIRSRIIEEHQKEGFPDCRVELDTELNEATGDVSLRFVIAPGPRARISSVRIDGLEVVELKLAAKRLDVEVGQYYDTSKVRSSLRNLYLTGLFKTIDVRLEGDGEERTIVFTVTELPTVEFFVLPGYGSYERLRVVFGVDNKDFLGTGKKARLEANLSQLAQGARINFYDPFIGRNLHLTTTLSTDRRIEPSFTSIEYGVGASLARSWNESLDTRFGYQFRQSELEDVAADAETSVDDQNINLGTLTLTTTWDERDSIFYPTDGARARVNFDLATKSLGSTVDFLKTQLDLTGYFDIGWEATAVIAWRGGIAIPLDENDIPIQERFFLGGENTIRSFGQGEVGVASGLAGGGEASNLFNVELRRSIVGNISGALFYDVGAIHEDYQDFGFDNLSSGLGFGVRYLLPIGPIRLDTAWNPDPQSGEDDWVIHLSVGMPF